MPKPLVAVGSLDALAEVALNDTQEWRRDSPFLNAAAAALGLSTEQLDALFVAAREIQL